MILPFQHLKWIKSLKGEFDGRVLGLSPSVCPDVEMLLTSLDGDVIHIVNEITILTMPTILATRIVIHITDFFTEHSWMLFYNVSGWDRLSAVIDHIRIYSIDTRHIVIVVFFIVYNFHTI